jgi:hypothetical protein
MKSVSLTSNLGVRGSNPFRRAISFREYLTDPARQRPLASPGVSILRADMPCVGCASMPLGAIPSSQMLVLRLRWMPRTKQEIER